MKLTWRYCFFSSFFTCITQNYCGTTKQPALEQTQDQNKVRHVRSKGVLKMQNYKCYKNKLYSPRSTPPLAPAHLTTHICVNIQHLRSLPFYTSFCLIWGNTRNCYLLEGISFYLGIVFPFQTIRYLALGTALLH